MVGNEESVQSLRDFLMQGARSSEFPAAYIPGHELLELLGQGSLGRIFLARNNDNAFVAIKVLRESGSSTAFTRESSIGLQLQHPHIVRTLSVGEAPMGQYAIMQHCKAGSLRQHIGDHGPLQTAAIVTHGLRILEALEYLHTKALSLDGERVHGVVHCDVKPGNILLDEVDGTLVPMLSDFGLVRAVGDSPHGGTPAFMAPEQLDGETVTPATDVWGAAACLYFLLTHEPIRNLRGGTDRLADVRAKRIIPLERKRPELPQALCHVIGTALSNHPDDRYESCAAMADALLDAYPNAG